jgi:hypothetical protein
MEITPKVVEKKEEITDETKYTINASSIGSNSRSHVLPFLLTYENFNFNVNNYLVDSRYSSNLMPYYLCQNINVVPKKSTTRIIQLDRLDVKVRGELKYVMIRLAFYPRVHHVIDIIVIYIPKAYGLFLSRDRSTN